MGITHIFSRHTEWVLVVRGDKRRGKKDAIVVRIRDDFPDEIQEKLFLRIVSTGQQKYVTLHAMDKHSRDDLYVGVGFFDSLQVLSAVVFACIELSFDRRVRKLSWRSDFC